MAFLCITTIAAHVCAHDVMRLAEQRGNAIHHLAWKIPHGKMIPCSDGKQQLWAFPAVCPMCPHLHAGAPEFEQHLNEVFEARIEHLEVGRFCGFHWVPATFNRDQVRA